MKMAAAHKRVLLQDDEAKDNQQQLFMPSHWHFAVCTMNSNMLNACTPHCASAGASDEPMPIPVPMRLQRRHADERSSLLPLPEEEEEAPATRNSLTTLYAKQLHQQHLLSMSLLGCIGLLMWLMLLVLSSSPSPRAIQSQGSFSTPRVQANEHLRNPRSTTPALVPASTWPHQPPLVPVPPSVRVGVPGNVPNAVPVDASLAQWNPVSSPELEPYFDIYCRGPLLHTFQSANLFPDSKHFVDMPIKTNSSASQVLDDFRDQKLSFDDFEGTNWAQYRTRLRRFLATHFENPGADLVPVTPVDYQEHSLPPMICKIQDPMYREWAFALHQLWKTLGRVHDTNMKGSFLAPKSMSENRRTNVLIVPGGRFRESYYWDSYWIVHGLLISDMPLTARGVVNNLLEYVQQFGFVPNGGRIYYLTRSQPPMLSEMVRLVARQRHVANNIEFDTEFLASAVPILEKEYAFWMQRGPRGHAVEIVMQNPTTGLEERHVLNRFVSMANNPRPESYREDVSVASLIVADANIDNTSHAQALRDKYYNEVIAAAESGWDFSSRWLCGSNDMRAMDTSNVVPVDLNAVLYRMERNLMAFHHWLGNWKQAKAFELAAIRRARAIDAVLWSDKHQSWKDFLLRTRTHSEIVSISDFTPLWAKAFNRSDHVRNQRIVESLVHSDLIQEGGVQTTTVFTGQQWDSPNAWPPQQDLLIDGLLNMNTKESHELARALAKTWIKGGLTAWDKTELMFEKFNATERGMVGVGGEYFPQFGFGWTNGVVLKMLTVHQNLLVEDDEP